MSRRWEWLALGCAALAMGVSVNAWDRRTQHEDEKERLRLEILERELAEKYAQTVRRELAEARAPELLQRLAEGGRSRGWSQGSRAWPWQRGGGSGEDGNTAAVKAVVDWYESIEEEVVVVLQNTHRRSEIGGDAARESKDGPLLVA
ncbi:hypothetical protein CDCA_CDCA08G2292 [Cyanidium caldarium]|uniref:Uncharacterized protein n=1 Tax=Cyanidium caldarium TaxID=2771 RepID=A0AAV9IV99_CYACA|nr:hypothetical protein CDCA_CDCA08G2292 [Cyanidium caldarium]|eukprot:ctg_282.g104